MRLRLTVERHLLPSVRLLWVVSPSTAPGAGLTVSQFLEQVNEIVQLEADEWGLEDYAVEVQGFECLHFSEIHRLLKEDDEVHIRPLQTPDLRARKISGRHQITEDGRHLVDGVAFGRALLRKPSRPPIHIPPRKRRRLLMNEEDDSLLPEQLNQQVALRPQSDDLLDTNFEDLDASDDEQDSDFSNEDELGDELQDIQEDQGNGLGIILNADGTPFDGSGGNEESENHGSLPPKITNGALRPARRRLLTAQEDSNETTVSKGKSLSDRGAERRLSFSGSNKSVRFEGEDTGTPATIRLSQDSEDDDSDDDFEPDASDASDKENAPPRGKGDDTSTSGDDESEVNFGSSSVSSSSIDVSTDDETSSSGSSSTTSSSDTDSEGEPEEMTNKKMPTSTNDANESSSSSSSATSSSESSSESDTERGSKKPQISPTTSVDDVKPHAAKTAQTNKPSGTGKRATRTRNSRRRKHTLMTRLVEQGLLPSGSSVADAVRFWEARRNNKDPEANSESALTQVTSTDVEARREALLKSIECGGVDVNEDVIPASTTPRQEDTTIALTQGNQKSPVGEAASTPLENSADIVAQVDEGTSVVQVKDSLDEREQGSNEVVLHDSASVPIEDNVTSVDVSQVQTSETPKASDSSARASGKSTGDSARRSKLDLAGSKRLLFGSLGLKAPKTKEDGIKLQEKLMSNVKPVKQPASSAKEVLEKPMSALTAAGDESWRDKIELSAVECWDWDVELSAPPFPFVQRWDPQYQRQASISKRKQKKRKRNNTTYYEDQYDDSFNDGAANKSPRKEDYNPIMEEALFDKLANEIDLRNGVKQSDSGKTSQDAQGKSPHFTNESVSMNNEVELAKENDLPFLPKDSSNCPVLSRSDCKIGAVVAFKKFELELGNEWHPYISEYRTAKVDAVYENGVLDLTYAKRDVPADQRRYNEETGERILGKLEMPGYDSDSEEADPSKVSIDFAELIEPVLVQAAEDVIPAPNAQAQPRHLNATTKPDEQALPPLQTELETQSLVDKQLNDGQVEIRQSSQSSSAELEYHDAETREDVEPDDHGANERKDPQTLPNIVEDSQPHPRPRPTTQTREDMSQLFHDAGWRSSIGSDIKRMLQLEQDSSQPPTEPERLPKEATPSSSAIHGSSSPRESPEDNVSSAQPDTQSTPQINGQIPDSAPREGTTTDSALLRPENSIEYPTLPEMDDGSVVPSQRSPPPPSQQPSKSSPPPISPPPLGRQASILPKVDLPSQMDGASEKKSSKEDIPSYTFLSDASMSSEEFPEILSQSFEKRLDQQAVAPSKAPHSRLSISPKRAVSTSIKVKRESTRSTSPTHVPTVKKEKRSSRARKLFTRPSFTSLRPSSQGESKRTASQVLGGKKSKKSRQQPAASQVTIDENSGFDDTFGPRFTQSQPVNGESQRRSPALTQESEIVDLTVCSDGPAATHGDDVGTYEMGKADTSSESLPTGSGWVSKKGKGKKTGRSFP